MIGIGGISTVPLVFIKKPGIIGKGGVDLGGIQTDKVLYLPGYIMPDGKLMDRSGNNYHGTITGATRTRLPSGQWEENYDGNDFIELDAPLMNFTSGDLSIFMWVKTTNMAGYQYLLTRGMYGQGYYFLLYPNGQIKFQTNSGGAASQESLSAAGAVVVNKRYRVGATRSGASVRIYNNGLDVTSTVGVHINPAASNNTVKIGIFDDKAGSPLIGQSGAITVIAAAVTPAWAANDWNQGRWLYGV